MTAKIWYLYHSGFAVDTGTHVLIFDYWRNTPKGAGLDQGVVDPKALRDRNVILFCSHSHSDHYNPAIFKWEKDIPQLRVVLSSDIPARQGALMMGPRQKLTQPEFSVETFLSNDQGVAFLVDISGFRIYHGGDLNWWHWQGEPDDYNKDMAARYKEQVGYIPDEPIDLAFVPVDPRLQQQYNWGVNYLLERKEISHVVPMHFGDDSSIVDKLLADPASAFFRDRVIPLKTRGQMAELPKN